MLTDIIASHIEWASDAVGKRLLAVRAEVFQFEGRPTSHPLKLELDFGDKSVILTCASDGETLSVSSEPLRSADTSEAGSVEVADWSGVRPFARVAKLTLDDVQAIYDRRDHALIGVTLRFGSERMDIVNLGDEMIARSAIDEALLEGARRV